MFENRTDEVKCSFRIDFDNNAPFVLKDTLVRSFIGVIKKNDNKLNITPLGGTITTGCKQDHWGEAGLDPRERSSRWKARRLRDRLVGKSELEQRFRTQKNIANYISLSLGRQE